MEEKRDIRYYYQHSTKSYSHRSVSFYRMKFGRRLLNGLREAGWEDEYIHYDSLKVMGNPLMGR